MTVDPSDPEALRVFEITDDASGLDALVVVDAVEDELTIGGIQRGAREQRDETLRAAKRHARAWTLACRAAGIDSGGGHVLVQDGGELDPKPAYRALGRAIDGIDPPFLGLTFDEEASALAEASERVDPEGTVPARAQAVGVLSGIQAVLWALEGDPRAEGRDVLVHGYGPVAGFVAQGMSEEGAKVRVAAGGKAREAAKRAGHATIEADAWTEQAADVLVPAQSATITTATADELDVGGVVPAAFQPLASRKAARVLADRGLQYAPDAVVGGGAIVEAVLSWREGHAPRVEDEIDRRLSQIYDRTRRVLAQAADGELTPDDVVQERWG